MSNRPYVGRIIAFLPGKFALGVYHPRELLPGFIAGVNQDMLDIVYFDRTGRSYPARGVKPLVGQVDISKIDPERHVALLNPELVETSAGEAPMAKIPVRGLHALETEELVREVEQAIERCGNQRGCTDVDIARVLNADLQETRSVLRALQRDGHLRVDTDGFVYWSYDG